MSVAQKAPIITPIKNPIINKDFPDPTVINVDGIFYAYATNSTINGKPAHIQVARSENLQDWTLIGDALPEQPVWADHDFWAPHVLYDSDIKQYVLFYSGESGHGKCLGIAYADAPQGPFRDSGAPLVCGEGFVNIDPMAFIDPQSKKKYLYWGSDHQPIKVQEMKDDWSGFKPNTTPIPVMEAGQEKEYDRLIEGAWVDYHQGYYYLYYSGDNCCGPNASYAVLVARSKQPTGPFERLGTANRSNRSVFLEKDSLWLAPGHNSIFRDDHGQAYIAYHAIPVNPTTGKPDHYGRVALIQPIRYQNGWPTLLSSQTTTPTDTITLADPTIFYDKGTYYLYGTGAPDGFIVYTSTDLKTWHGPSGANDGYALHKKDSFGSSGFWAPQLFKHHKQYYMIYTANEQLAIATSTSPLGPFKQSTKRALNGNTKQIDPFVFFDKGKPYLYFVRLTDGNRIFVAELNATLDSIKESTITPCIAATEAWENTENAPWPVAEGPTVIKKDNMYYLLYSANDFRNPAYAIGYATADHPLGPWKKYTENPIINKDILGHNGTGHGDIFKAKDGQIYYVLHTHNSNQKVAPRKTALVKLQFEKRKNETVLKLLTNELEFIIQPISMIVRDASQ
ncbi:hypothetical protein GCM10023231_32930 [Olivibacter ginsenosidimutans]|uniref:Family 43 glycosylhydrolase n=1 Tax=Olivibacter ginsenosidimutans TaxID=1176537 RepID=A0ABP9C1D3_9SPHI